MNIRLFPNQIRTLRNRFFLCYFLAGILLLGALYYTSLHRYNAVETTRKQSLLHMVTIGRSAIDPYVKGVRQGTLTYQQALQKARAAVRSMTYTDHTGKNYLFMSGYDGTMLVQPFEPDKEGRNFLELQDANGLFIIKELIKTAKNIPDGGFVSYYYHPPNLPATQKKISFVLGIPELRCYIGTGAYVGDIEAASLQFRYTMLISSSFGIFLLFPIFFSLFCNAEKTAQKKEEQLVEQENEIERLSDLEFKYRTITDNSIEGIVIVQDNVFKLVNPPMTTITGLPLENLEGMPLTQMIHPEDRGLIISRHERRMKGENAPSQYSFRIITTTGKIKWLLNNTVRILWDGRPATLSMLSDITDLKSAQATLEDKEAKFRSLMEQAPIPIAILDIEGNLNEANAQWKKAWRNSSQNFSTKYTIFEDTQLLEEDIAQEIRKAFTGSPVVTRPVRYILSGTPHEIRWVSIRLYPIQDKHGQLNGLVLMHDDRTESILAEERNTSLLQNLSQANHNLRNAQALTKDIIDSMPSVLICVDSEERIVLWNQAASDVFQIAESHVLGQPFARSHPRLRIHNQLVHQAMLEQHVTRQERVHFVDNKQNTFMDIVVYPLGSENQGAVVRIDDVSERVRMEEIMIQTEKMMSVGGLAAGMAHEINNPLGGIMQGAQNMQRRLFGDIPANHQAAEKAGTSFENIKEYVQERGIQSFLNGINESGTRAAQIVANMLNFSRKDEGFFAPTNMQDLMDKALELAANDYDLKKRYDFKHVIIQKEYLIETPDVTCTPSEIEQVFLNLLKNATQALAEKTGPAGKATITLTIGPDPMLSNHVRIVVSDNGPGMTEEQKNRCFEPFYTTKEIGVGTGLGLSVSYFIITTKHSGKFLVESTPDNGAHFIILLPIKPQKT